MEYEEEDFEMLGKYIGDQRYFRTKQKQAQDNTTKVVVDKQVSGSSKDQEEEKEPSKIAHLHNNNQLI